MLGRVDATAVAAAAAVDRRLGAAIGHGVVAAECIDDQSRGHRCKVCSSRLQALQPSDLPGPWHDQAHHYSYRYTYNCRQLVL